MGSTGSTGSTGSRIIWLDWGVARSTVRLALLLVSLAGGMAPAFAGACGQGNGCGGGGGACQASGVNQGFPILLDLAVNDPTLVDRRGADASQLQDSPASRHLGLDYQDMTRDPAYRHALQRIKAWEGGASRKTTLTIEQALSQLIFAKTSYRFGAPERAAIPPGSACGDGHTRQVIQYVDSIAVISIPTWNELGLVSQSGLLIHEALRQIQIYDGYHGTDAELEQVTAHIEDNDPRPDESLVEEFGFFHYHPDTPRYFEKRKKLCSLLRAMSQWRDLTLTPTERRETIRICNWNQALDFDEFGRLLNDISSQVGHTASVELVDRLVPLADTANDLSNIYLQELLSGDDNLFRQVTQDLTKGAPRELQVKAAFELYDRYLTRPGSLSQAERREIGEFERMIAPRIREAFEKASASLD